jgi:hypothetical protein
VSSLPPLISFTIRTIILRNNTNSAWRIRLIITDLPAISI